VPSVVAAATAPTSAGTTESSGGPPPPTPTLTPNNGDKGKGKGKGERQEKQLRQQQWGQQHPSVALLQSLDRHRLDVVKDVPSSAAGSPTIACPSCCTVVL
jgi:hypothetical protein